MKKILSISILVFCIAVGFGNGEALAQGEQARFMPVEIIVDSGSERLSAYHMEISFTFNESDSTSSAQIVGLEGGEHSAFNKAPYYDARALYGSRVIIAALSPSDDLPQGSQRVATLHLRFIGANPVIKTRLISATNHSIENILLKISTQGRSGDSQKRQQ